MTGYEITSPFRNVSKRCGTLSPAGAVGSTGEPKSNSSEVDETASTTTWLVLFHDIFRRRLFNLMLRRI